MMLSTITNQDLKFGLQAAMGRTDLREEVLDNMEKQSPALARLWYIWGKANADLRGPEDSPSFLKEVGSWWSCSMVALGTLYSANGKHFPSVTDKLIDGVMGESEGKNYEECGAFLDRIRKKMQNLNGLWAEAFEDSGSLHPFGQQMLYYLTEMILSAMEKEKDSLHEDVQKFLKEN